MLSYSAFIITFVIFSGLISGLPNMNRLEIRLDSISQSNRGLFSSGSNMTPLSNYRRRGIFGERKHKIGVKCDSTFYKQSRVEAMATKACRDSFIVSGQITSSNHLANMFRGPRLDFPAPNLFPQERMHKLTMTRITRGFFSFRRVRTFLRLAKRDYIVFANACRSVGIVRQMSKTEFVVCNEYNGGTGMYSAPMPSLY